MSENQESKELLTAFASLMLKKLSHKEIVLFCVAMLDAEMKLKMCKKGGIE